MGAVVNLIRGSVRLEVQGAYPEGFLNRCGAERLSFWGVEWVDAITLRLTVPQRERERALALGKDSRQWDCRVLSGKGVPAFLSRFRRRYGFLAGLLTALLAVALLSHVVLVIEVSGNEEISTQVILQELREAGLRPGTFGPTLNARSVAHQVLMADTRLCYMAVNLHGIRAEVIVREAIPAPEVTDRKTPSNLVATEDGVITRMEIYAGEAQTETADVVREGEVLVSGRLVYRSALTDEVLYRGSTASLGEVWAETWQEQGAIFPLNWKKKVYTGREKRKFRLKVLHYSLKFYRNGGISYDNYDKITVTKQLTLPGGLRLPIWWTEDRYREYETVPVQHQQSESDLETALTEALQNRLGEEDEILETRFQAETGEGFYSLSLTARCSQQIARQEPILTEGNDTAND